jgi:hypothetical protein
MTSSIENCDRRRVTRLELFTEMCHGGDGVEAFGTNDSPPEAHTGLRTVKLTEELWMAPLSSEVRSRYGIPLSPFDDDDCNDLPATLNSLCCTLSRRGLVNLTTIMVAEHIARLIARDGIMR